MSLTHCLDVPRPNLRNSLFRDAPCGILRAFRPNDVQRRHDAAPAGFTDVFVTGPWCGWCANDTYNTMTDDDGDGIYSVSVTIDGVALGDLVEYKYAINGFATKRTWSTTWWTELHVHPSRTLPVTPTVKFPQETPPTIRGTCDGTCNDGSVVSTTADVTFQVT